MDRFASSSAQTLELRGVFEHVFHGCHQCASQGFAYRCVVYTFQSEGSFSSPEVLFQVRPFWKFPLRFDSGHTNFLLFLFVQCAEHLVSGNACNETQSSRRQGGDRVCILTGYIQKRSCPLSECTFEFVKIQHQRFHMAQYTIPKTIADILIVHSGIFTWQ